MRKKEYKEEKVKILFYEVFAFSYAYSFEYGKILHIWSCDICAASRVKCNASSY